MPSSKVYFLHSFQVIDTVTDFWSFYSLGTESAYAGHDISQREASQWHQRCHCEDIGLEDRPQNVFDGHSGQDGQDDGGDHQDAETNLWGGGTLAGGVSFLDCCNRERAVTKKARVKARWLVESHFLHHGGVAGLAVVDDDADGAGHQGEDQSGHDASVRHGSLQVLDPSAQDVEQQRHHAEGSDAGAGRHDNAGMEPEQKIGRDEPQLDQKSQIVHTGETKDLSGPLLQPEGG